MGKLKQLNPAEAARYGPMRKPDVVCIGVQKAATSWLHNVIRARPEIWVPPYKEVHFFDHKFIPHFRGWIDYHYRSSVESVTRTESRKIWPSEDRIAYINRVATEKQRNGKWYMSVFGPARDDQLCLDVTPEYFVLPEEGVAFFNRFLPKAKVILIIRDPVGRAISQLRMNIRRHRHNPVDHAGWMHLANASEIMNRGDYASFLPLWDKYLDPDRFLILPFGDVGQDPAGTTGRIDDFLGLSRNDYRDAEKPAFKSPNTDIPDRVRGELAEKLASQYEYLRQRFDEDFLSRI